MRYFPLLLCLLLASCSTVAVSPSEAEGVYYFRGQPQFIPGLVTVSLTAAGTPEHLAGSFIWGVRGEPGITKQTIFTSVSLQQGRLRFEAVDADGSILKFSGHFKRNPQDAGEGNLVLVGSLSKVIRGSTDVSSHVAFTYDSGY